MYLASLLDPKLIYFEEQQLTKLEAFQKLVGMVCAHYKIPNCDTRLNNLIMKRESESSTVYNTGLAIPHARLENFNDTLIGICIPRKPIMDEGNEIRFIVLIVTDQSSAKLYLNIVSDLVKLSKNPHLFDKIINAKDSAAVLNIIKEANIVIKEDLTIKDIMNCEPVTINAKATLKEMGNLLSDNNISLLPVVDDNCAFIGEVNILQFLKVGIPDYMMMMTNVNFLRSYEPFEHLFEQEEKVLVSDIMSRDAVSIRPDASIIEVVFDMIQSDRRFYTVTQDKKVVGIITAMDIFRKVVRA